MSSLDREFARFVATGDAGALARVFDATAPELLAVAFHLLRDSGAAEDCLQETFLAAIESAASFESGRRVMPWLVAIMTKRCRRRYRERERARRTQQDADFPADVRQREPVEEVEDREFRQQLALCLDNVVEPYRTVLRLRLDDELPPEAIATRLGRKPSTVRTQLQRGIDQLRVSLPRGVAPAAVFVPVRSIEEVRRVVLERGQGFEGCGTVGGASAIGKAVAVGGVALLVLTATTLLGIRGFWTSSDGPEDPDASTAVVQAGVGEDEVGAGAAEPEVREVVEPLTTERTRGDEALLFGLCVDAVTRVPVSGAKVALEAEDRSSNRRSRSSADADVPEPVMTGADGSFVLKDVPTHRHEYELTIASPNHVIASTRFNAPYQQFSAADCLVPGTDRDFGIVALETGHRVRGRVVDPDGQPVAGVALRARVQLLSIDSRPRIHRSYAGRSDALGAFELDGRLPNGAWKLELASRSVLADQRLPRLELGSGSPVGDLVCRVMRRETISGTLTDRNGDALGRVALRAIDLAGRTVASGRTSKNGAFVLYGNSNNSSDALRIEPERSDRFEPIEPVTPLFFGARGLRLRSQRIANPTANAPATGNDLTLRVSDAVSGEPIESFGYSINYDSRVSPPNARIGPSGRGRLAERPGGIAELRDMPPGSMIAFIQPGSDRYRAPGGLAFEMNDEATEVSLEVAPLTPLSLRVTDSTGSAAIGAWLELIACRPERDPSTLVGQRVARAERTRGDWRPILLDAAFADAAGEATLRYPQGTEGLVMRATHGSDSAVFQVAAPGEAVLAIGFAPSFRVAGRVVPADAVSLPMTVAVTRPGGPRFGAVPIARVDTNGEFAFEGLAPGVWEVRLRVGLKNRLGGSGETELSDRPLTTLTVDAESGPSPRSLTLPLERFRMASLAGRIEEAASSGGLRFVSLECLEGGAKRALMPGFPVWSVGPIEIDRDGRFELEGILPGRYRLLLHGSLVGATAAPGRVFKEALQIKAGMRLQRTFGAAAALWRANTSPFEGLPQRSR